MKKFFFIAVSFTALSAFTLVNSIWKNDAAHSQLAFTVTHLGVNDVSGSMNDFQAVITATKPDFSDATFELTAKVASINTQVEARDNHLKSADFFDAEKYPTLTFKSTKVTVASKGKLKVTGDLTLHNVTKQVTLDATYRGTVENPMSKKPTTGFQITGTIKRSDFNIGGNFPTVVISDEVQIKADAEFIQ